MGAEQLTAKDLRRLDRTLRDLYVHANSATFPGRLLDSVRGLVDSEITCYTEIDADEARVLNVADPTSSALDSLLPVLADLQHEHPRIVDYADTGNARALTVSDYLSKKDWHRRDLFRHFYGALGLEDQVTVMIPAEDRIKIGLALNRTNRSFTTRDRALLDALQPHVALAWQNARAFSALEGSTGRGATETPGLVRFRGDGTPWFVSPRARRLLEDYFPRWKKHDGLPEPVASWLRARRADEPARAAGSDRARKRVRRAHGTLDLRLVEDITLEGGLLLFVEWNRAKQRASGLPPRLRRVLAHLLQGESEKQVAARLELSPHTVHEYVKQLYRRLGVSSRSELMARWVVREGGDAGS